MPDYKNTFGITEWTICEILEKSISGQALHN